MGVLRAGVLARVGATLGLLAVVAMAVGAGRADEVQRPRAVDQLAVDALFVAAIVWGAFGLAIVVAAMQRSGEATGRTRERPSLVRSLVSLLTMLALLAAVVSLFDDEGDPMEQLELQAPAAAPGEVEPEEQRETIEPRWGGVGVVSVLVIIGGAVAIALALRGRPRRGRALLLPLDPVAEEPFDRVTSASLDALDTEPDPRRAVIAAYARMEDMLCTEGIGRRASETPYEFLQRALGVLGAGAPSAAGLTEIFTRARYSTQPVTESDRDAARRHLRELEGERRAGAVP